MQFALQPGGLASHDAGEVTPRVGRYWLSGCSDSAALAIASRP